MTDEIERFDPASQVGRISYEHLHRYAMCRELVDGLKVLDIGCGTGYGSALLAKRAGSVVAVDVDPKAVAAAKKRFKLNNLTFAIADCYDLPFDDGTFDVVVANEMIEHIDNHNDLLTEITRVLGSNGIALVSTPNKPIYNRFKTPNPFHVSEMEIAEFRNLMDRHFREVTLIGQRMALVSASFELERDDAGKNLHDARTYCGAELASPRPTAQDEELWLEDPEYILAVATNSEAGLSQIGPTIFFSRDVDLWLEHERIMAWASQLHDEDELLRTDLRQAKAEEEAALAQLQSSRDQVVALGERLEDMRGLSSIAQQLLEQRAQADDAAFGANLGTLSRLVGQLLGRSVEAQQSELIAALFDLKEEVVIQRERMQRNQTLEAEIDQLRKEVASSLVNCQLLELDKGRAEQEIASLSQASQSAEAQRIGLEVETKSLRTQLQEAISAAEAEHAALELERAQREELIKAQELARANAEGAQAEIGELRAKLQEAISAADAEHAALELERAQREELIKAQELARANAEGAQAEIGELRAKLEEVVAVNEAGRTTMLADHRTAAVSSFVEQGSGAVAAAESAGGGSWHPSTSAAVLAERTVDQNRKPDPRKIKSENAFRQLHQRTYSSLTKAHITVRDRFPADQDRRADRPSAWMSRLKIAGAPFKTAIFDRAWVRMQAPSLRTLNLARLVADVRLRGLDPHPLFSVDHYLTNSPDLDLNEISPLAHYIEHGWREGRDPHPYFANDWYLAENLDVLASGRLNPLDHYLQFGWKEGRWPNPVFDTRAYLNRYPDVDQAGVEPLTHFVTSGFSEGREAQFRGMESEWTRLLPAKSAGRPLMEYLLTADPPVEAEEDSGTDLSPSSLAAAKWPPKPLDEYWPPQAFRDFIIDGYGEETIHLYWYLYSVMAAYSDRQGEFRVSQACDSLIARAKQRAAECSIPDEARPEASIIIPVYNNILDTVLCIVSILDTDQGRSFEIIVADDGSSDSTPQIIKSIGGAVRYIRQPKNYGFLGNCNEAAKHANGQIMVLLNNDTLALPGWLDALLAPFNDTTNVGLVGSKLINWDGTLQEAGGIYWRDGSAWNFGRGQNARAPQFSYLKDVDYCSGAAIAIPAELWRKVGGFDPAYNPAYCEDSDLAFRLRDAGYRTLLAPAAEVVHHEGRSHGRDLSSGIKASQVINQQRLFERWKTELERDHFPNGENVLRARDRSFTKRHVLVIDHYVPQWDQDAGSRSMYQYIKLLIEIGSAVTFWPENLWQDPKYTPMLQSLGVEVIYGPEYRGKFGTFLKERKDLYDAVFLSRPHVAKQFIGDIRQFTKAKVLYCGQDLHFRRLEAALKLGEDVSVAEISATRQLELEVCGACDVIFYPSAEEVREIAGLIGGNREFIPNPVFLFDQNDLAKAKSSLAAIMKPRPARLLFVGGFSHTPNREGIVWFVREVMPRVLAKLPDAKLDVVGSKPPSDVLELAGQAVNVIGFVSDEDLAELYAEASIAVAPLRFGAGVKGKVIEAMASGVPVATTSFGAQGIEPAERMLFLGNSAEELAQAIIQALSDRSEAKNRARAALQFIQANYSKAAFGSLLDRLIPHNF